MPGPAPYPLATMTVKPEWVDFNGHMNDAAYAAAFSDALMVMTDRLGLDAEGRARTGCTVYTLTMMIRYLNEAPAGSLLVLSGRILDADDKRIRVWAEMRLATSALLLATTEQLFLCVVQSEGTSRAGRWPEPFATQLRALASEHAELPFPEGAGEGIRLTRKAT